MTDCDRIKVHISDYLEKHLSPQLKNEFESHITNCTECKLIVEQIPVIKSLLAKSPQMQCSEDFNLKLRQKLSESNNSPYFTNTKVKQISYAFSFAAVIFLVFFGVNLFTNNDNLNNPPPQVQNKEFNVSPSKPNQMINHSTNSVIPTEELEVRTKNSDGLAVDSTKGKRPGEKDSRIKYVDSNK